MVSVIIPSFNNAQWLASCLDSCLSQELLKEIIVVDNSSTDKSVKIIEGYKNRYPDKIVFLQNPNKGANYSRNLGFAHASGEYIQWLDSDDRLLPGKFKAQINAIKAQGADIAYSDWQMDYYDEISGKFIQTEKKQNRPYPDFLFEILQNKHWSSPNTYLLSRKIAGKLADLSAWNPYRIIEQDREYFTIAAIIGAKFVYVPGTYAIYNRWSNQSISKMSFDMRLEHSSVLAQSLIERIKTTILENNEKYVRVLKTELLISKYYHPKLRVLENIRFKDLYWPMIHWKLRIPIALSILFSIKKKMG